MDQNLKNFFEQNKNLDHYNQINTPPVKFDNWFKNDLTYEYSEWIQYNSNCPSLSLDIDMPLKEIQEEVRSIFPEFIKHRGESHPGWYSVTLHGVDKNIRDDWKSNIYQGKWKEEPSYTWTSIKDRCPTTISWILNNWHFKEFHRIRFMLLKPNGVISPHKDYECKKLAAYNVAIINPNGVEFCMQDAGLIPWKEGESRAIDIGRVHSVVNNSSKDRVHMIIHGKCSKKHHEILCKSYDKLLINLGKK